MCDPVQVSRWVAGELAGSEAAALEAHVDGCPDCGRTARDLRRVAAALEALPLLTPGAVRRAAPRRRPRLAWAAGVAVALAALLWTWGPHPQSLVAPARLERGDYTVSVEGPGAELLSLEVAQDGQSRVILESVEGEHP